MLPDKFFSAYQETAEKPVTEAPEEEAPKSYTAAEVDALVNERVAAAIEEIKKSFSEPDDPVERKKDYEENSGNEEA